MNTGARQLPAVHLKQGHTEVTFMTAQRPTISLMPPSLFTSAYKVVSLHAASICKAFYSSQHSLQNLVSLAVFQGQAADASLAISAGGGSGGGGEGLAGCSVYML